MYCPQCGQQQASAELRFCSRCGFPLGGVIALLSNGGQAATENTAKVESARRRGIKQGAFISLLTFVVVPIISIITVWLRMEPFAVAISSVLFFFGGLLRIAYAFMFESNDQPGSPVAGATQKAIHQTNAQQLPPAQSMPAAAFVPPRPASWRETNDLEPSSVIDNTTKLLQKED